MLVARSHRGLLVALTRRHMTSPASSQRLLVAEQDLREALDRITDGFVVYSRDWRLLYLNRPAEKYFGRPREELLGRIVWEEFPAAAGTEAERALRRAAERAEPTDMEMFAPAMKRLVHFRVFPSDRGVSISFRDVTAEHQVAEALRASEAQYRALFEHALDGILLTSPTGEILAANEAACRMLGRTEAEIRAVGRPGVVDATDPRVAPALEERRRTGYVRAELTFRRKDGSKFPAEVCSTIYVDAEGHERTSMTVRDLTESKRAQDRLRLIADAGAVLGSTLESEATLRDLTQLTVPHMADFCIVDLIEGDRLRRVAASHHDASREPALMAAGSPGPLLWKDTGLYKVARTGEAEFVPFVDDAWLRGTTRDDAHFAIARANAPRSAIMVPLIGHAGVIGVLTLALDNESRRYDLSDLATARAIADRAALAMENARLYEQAVEAKRLRDEVLGIVSHDLRNPLNAILLTANVLARRLPAEEEISTIVRAAKRADALIRDLLTVAALEAAAVPLEKESHLLSAVVDEAIILHRPLGPGAIRRDRGVRGCRRLAW